MKIFDKKLFAVVILLIFHFAYRFFLLSIDAFPFNSDEAIVGLMAKHILEGKHFLYFYGQSYMGSLDAYLIAIGFRLLGEKVFVIRLVQIILYAISIVFVYLFIAKAFKNNQMAFLGSLFFVFPPVNVVLYTTVTLGGYGEALLIGIVGFYLSEIILEKIGDKNVMSFVLLQGFLVGLGLFVNPLSLTIMIPAVVYMIYRLVRGKNIYNIKGCIPVFILSFFIGSSPFWYSLLFSNGIFALQEITGSAVAVETTSYLSKIFSHTASFFLFGLSVIFGLRPPWNVEWIGIFFIPIVIFFWFLIFYLILSRKHHEETIEKFLFLLLVAVITIGGFIFTSFGVDPSGRYFLPIIFPISVILGYSIFYFRNKLVSILFVFVIAYQIYGVFSLSAEKPYLTTQFYGPAQVDHSNISKLIQFLQEEKELYGFSNYWVSYPLAFLSDEKIISVPQLPYHNDLRFTERDNRIDYYNDLVQLGERYFYITTNNPPLDKLIQEKLSENKIEYKIKNINDYQIYYDLSKKITPQELGLKNEFK
jgi:4-amino-4-deoxy-L-arabinose transferase-like glycosyltransferase